MMNPALHALFEAAARRLSGWGRVDFWLDQPYNSQAGGCCFLDQDTKSPVIMVRPELWQADRERFFYNYLHEVAHCKLHAKQLKPGKGRATQPVYPDNLRGDLLSISHDLDELAADLQAHTWLLSVANHKAIADKLLQLMRRGGAVGG